MPVFPRDDLFQQNGATTSTFIVEIGGRPFGRFTEVDGLQVEVEVETYKEGGENAFEHKFPGRMSWPNLVLKRGVTWHNDVIDWFNNAAGETFAAEGRAYRETVGVSLVNGQGERLRTWTFYEAIPIKWTGPTLSVDSESVASEELEIAHHGFDSVTHA